MILDPEVILIEIKLSSILITAFNIVNKGIPGEIREGPVGMKGYPGMPGNYGPR